MLETHLGFSGLYTGVLCGPASRRNLGQRFTAHHDVVENWDVIPLGFLHNGATLRYFSMVTTVRTLQTIAAQELRIECLFPVDESTEALHLELMSRAPIQDHHRNQLRA